MKRIIDFLLSLQFIFKPSYWIMNIPYSKHVDDLVKELLNKNDFSFVDDYHAEIGGVSLWVENYPYSCFYIHKTFEYSIKYRPSRLTIQKGIRKLNRFRDIEENKKFDNFIKSISKS